MKRANIVHADLNPCGGAEQVAIATIQALTEMDLEVELTVARCPDISRLRNAFGARKVDVIFSRIKRINLLDTLLTIQSKNCHDGNDCGINDTITINTHGDVLPYYLPCFSKVNAITYCHYPIVPGLALRRDPSYLDYLRSLGMIKFSYPTSKVDTGGNGKITDNRYTENDYSLFWQDLQKTYLMMLKHSTIITNSTFSKDAIQRELSPMPPVSSSTVQVVSEPIVIPPPVSVEEFRRATLYSKEREDFVVVISRFNPSKKLENAITLANMLKKQRIGKGMIIAGGLMPEDSDYYHHIVNLAKEYDVSDYVKFKVNVTSDNLKTILRKGKVYFHPMPGEPFGISVAEAMSCGLIPIVPSVGGHNDFVPKRYRYVSLEDAVGKISFALSASQEDRTSISNLVTRFSEANYVKSIQRLVANVLQGIRASDNVAYAEDTIA
ncbi:glycosyltransferase [Candidatus Nitrososphaera evergladensis]|uniref:glycosyltransferase n=1 Tax=Candidatus Nitrososphaera evergladensis TaxID=1459637 RepID=UPI0011E606F4|nr:glycosyltransferase [Candidatus Nitrososphaera evergladensis]